MGKKRVVHFGYIKAHVVQGFPSIDDLMKMSMYSLVCDIKTAISKYCRKEKYIDIILLNKLEVRYVFMRVLIFEDKKS